MGKQLPLIFDDPISQSIYFKSSMFINPENELFEDAVYEGSFKINVDVTDFIQTILTYSGLNVLQIQSKCKCKCKYPRILVQISDLYTFLKRSVLVLYENTEGLKEVFNEWKLICESVISRNKLDNESEDVNPTERHIYRFESFDKLTNSLSVSQFIPYIISQSLLIDNFSYSGIDFFHSGLIPFILSEPTFQKSKSILPDLFKPQNKENNDYSEEETENSSEEDFQCNKFVFKFLRNFLYTERDSQVFKFNFEKVFSNQLNRYKFFVLTREFLFRLIIIHQRLYFHYPTFIYGKQGIGKTEILRCLEELYSFSNSYLKDKLIQKDQSNSSCPTIFNVPYKKVNQNESSNPSFFPEFYLFSVDSIFTFQDFLSNIDSICYHSVIFVDQLNSSPDSSIIEYFISLQEFHDKFGFI
jgi:hypothetical protein